MLQNQYLFYSNVIHTLPTNWKYTPNSLAKVFKAPANPVAAQHVKHSTTINNQKSKEVRPQLGAPCTSSSFHYTIQKVSYICDTHSKMLRRRRHRRAVHLVAKPIHSAPVDPTFITTLDKLK